MAIYLYGASGHAKVICEILEASGLPVQGLFDDNPSVQRLLGYPVYHDFTQRFRSDADSLIISIGNNRIRETLAGKLPATYLTAIHPSAIVSPRARLGEGTVVMPGAILNSDTVVGRHCIINTSASIDHDCVIEDFAHISPNATLCGNVFVGKGAQVCAGAVIIPGKKLGRHSIVGAGSVVTEDLPDNVVAVGAPARIIKYTS